MRKHTGLIIILLILFLIGFVLLWRNRVSVDEIDSFEECVAAGNPVMLSYPAKCSANGKTFTEEVSDVNNGMGIRGPEKVIVNAEKPLECNINSTPLLFGETLAEYTCEAPGAYLSYVDMTTKPSTAAYFTVSTTTSKVTYGPVKVEVIESK